MNSGHLRPRIRSLVHLSLPHYFDPKVYIWNRFSSADALLVDIRERKEDKGTQVNWRKLVLQEALAGAPYKSRIYVQPTKRKVNKEKWKGDLELCKDERLHGFIVRNNDGDALLEACQVISELHDHKRKIKIPYRPVGLNGTHIDDYEGIIRAGVAKRTADGIIASLGTCPPHCIGKKCAVLVDVEQQAVQHCIIRYNNVGDTARPAQKELLARAVQRANEMGMAALARRNRKVTTAKQIECEMQTLKGLGFNGMMLTNPEMVEMANEIFD